MKTLGMRDDIVINRITADVALPIRHRVLWPDLPMDAARVSEDDTGLHFGAYYKSWLVGVASIFLNEGGARLRKFAVLTEYQGHGIGSTLVLYTIEQVEALGASEFWCDARQTAIPFYERFGMRVDSDPFDKRGVAYVRMSRPLQEGFGSLEQGDVTL
ncbi:GNAT family N-acetyltransferase [Pseudovibrio sp. SPO723]|uniref:GNAT family N-acetyltransferase n=1 Tax=Nesiotobacter zosterae TaxID=392721 RepID=UPI0029C51F2D|nr:GNAT family N-acetyltransferase [Pseudovibrio sp. SPO723]MDX5593435.1 GNAT family N-acetyltransferase [Pseudovibrio sp. SPO723]